MFVSHFSVYILTLYFTTTENISINTQKYEVLNENYYTAWMFQFDSFYLLNLILKFKDWIFQIINFIILVWN